MTVFSSSTCPKCKVLKMKLDKAGIEYTVNENMDDAIALGLKSFPYIQFEDGTLLDFGASIAWVKDMEAAQ